MFVLSSLERKKINLYEISLAKTSTKAFNLLHSFSLPEKFSKDNIFSFVTSSSIFIVNMSGDYLVMDHTKTNSASIEGKLPFSLSGKTLEKFNFSSKILFLNLESNKEQVQILSLETNSVNAISMERERKEEIYYDKIDTPRKSLIYFLKKKNLNTYIVYDANLLAKENESKIDQFSKHTLNDDFQVKQFKINPFDNNMMLIMAKDSKIFSIQKGRAEYKKIDFSLGGIAFAELVGYYNDQTSQKIENYKSLNQVIYHKEFSNVFLNLFMTLVDDVKDLINKVQNNFYNIMQNSPKEILTKTKHYLILFTQSEELIILNAFDKSLVLKQLHKNKTVYKILRETNEDINRNEKKYIFIVLKDKITDNLLSLKFNLESAELFEESEVINDLLFEEEIKNQCEMLIKNPSSSPVTLTGKLQKNSLNKYDSKFSVEIKENKVFGIKYKTSNGKLHLNIAWNLNMRYNTTALSSQFPNVHANLITTYHVMGKVFYKYIDSNILLLLSKVEHKTLLVTLINTSNGKVLHQSIIDNVDFSQKIYSVFEENLVVINYVKKEKNFVRNELFTIEMMKREIEHSFVNLLEKIFKISLWGEESHSDFPEGDLKENDLVFLTQTYILTRKIKGIYTSKSSLNVANKHLLFLMENNQVFLVDKRVVSPRRPLMKEDKAKGIPPVLDPLNSPYIDPELAPYSPIINFDFKYLMNINSSEDQINNILISPTQYESIFLVCTEGLNLECYKVFPDKTFDTLNVSFSYSLIGAFLFGILVIIL